MKALFLVLLFPALLFGQIVVNVDGPPDISYSSSEVNPVDVRNGNVIAAQYEIVRDLSGDNEYFDFVIHAYSYRDALKPSDVEALFTVDGLGKVFKALRWTSRYEPGKVVSSIVIRLSKEELKSISYAGSVGLKIGVNSFSFSHMARYDMRQIVARIEPHFHKKPSFYNSSTTGIKVIRGNRNGKSLTSTL